MQPTTAAPSGSPAARALDFARPFVARRWPGSDVAEAQALRGDASSRAYLRLRLGPVTAGAPETLIAMMLGDAAVALSSDELAVFGEDGPKELPFVNVSRYLAGITDALPRIEAVAEDRSILLLEDVGDTTLWEAATAAPDPLPEFRRALVWLARVQAAARDDGSGCYAFSQRFDARLFAWEFDHFLEFGVAPSAPAALVEASRDELAAVASHLGALPTVFCHRDFHAWNLHVQDDRLRVIDFQDALLAPALYDLASLLTDRSTPRLITEDREARLLEEFLALSPPPEGTEEGRRSYRLCALQRTLKVVGRFNYLADVKGKPQYRDMLDDVVPTARRQLAAARGLERTTELFDGWVRGAGGPPCAP
jgi:aminoglycoside/choline kinase family phosphotransferase